MKMQRVTTALTVINLGLLGFTMGRLQPASAQAVPAVLRGQALEIVDAKGAVRANIKLEPAVKMADGKTSPEEVVFRLRDPQGRIRVKLGANEEGAGFLLSDDTQQPGVHILAKGSGSSLRIANKDGKEQIVKP